MTTCDIYTCDVNMHLTVYEEFSACMSGHIIEMSIINNVETVPTRIQL